MADPLDLMAEHAQLIGSVVIAYNRVQWLISVLFVAFSGMPDEQAQDVFFAVKSDGVQRDIALAAGKTALAKHPALWEGFRTVIAEINDLAGERNAAVHTMWAVDWQYWGGPSLLLSKNRGRVGSDPTQKIEGRLPSAVRRVERISSKGFLWSWSASAMHMRS